MHRIEECQALWDIAPMERFWLTKSTRLALHYVCLDNVACAVPVLLDAVPFFSLSLKLDYTGKDTRHL